jgi:hypothetical protein
LKIRTGLSANVYGHPLTSLMISEESVNLLHSYTLSTRSNFDKVNFDVRYSITFQDTDNGGVENQFTTQRFDINADLNRKI